MNTLFPNVLLFTSFILLIFGCTTTQSNPQTSENINTSTLPPASETTPIDNTHQLASMTDARDGEVYPIVRIGKQIWMAENLRYNAPNSWTNPNYPSIIYGRLYDGATAQTVCPKGWHLPSDFEWNELEIILGMSTTDADKTGWRGEHGTKMKSTTDWHREGNGTNSSGFNAFPGGYFFDGDSTGGLGESMGYWASVKYPDNGAWIRFLASPMKGVNRMYDDDFGSNNRIACRCVKD